MIIKVSIKDIDFEFETSKRCFSPEKIDSGTLAMLSCVEFRKGLKVLDLGCGYGVVGITAAKIMDATDVYMVDVDQEAILYSAKNAIRNKVPAAKLFHGDGVETLNETGFDLILSNPPYHSDFSVAKRFIEKGFNRLKMGGKMFMVTKRKDWYKNKFISVFGGVIIREINGYFIFEAEKRSYSYAKKRG